MKENQLIHGDSLEILKSFPDNSIDAVITDPPYGYLKHKLDAYFDHKELFPILYQILKDDSLLLFFGRGELLARWIVTCCDLGMKFKEELIWDKRRPSNFMNALLRSHEQASLLGKGNKKLNKVKINKIEYDLLSDVQSVVFDLNRLISGLKNKTKRAMILEYIDNGTKQIWITRTKTKHNLAKSQKTGDTFPSVSTIKAHIEGKVLSSILRVKKEHYKYKHPTQKPLKLMKQLVELTTNEGDLVLDPFCGSATTAIACLELNRKYICIEKDKEYYEIAKERIAKWHNEKKDGNPEYELPKEIDRIVVDQNNQLKLF